MTGLCRPGAELNGMNAGPDPLIRSLYFLQFDGCQTWFFSIREKENNIRFHSDGQQQCFQVSRAAISHNTTDPSLGNFLGSSIGKQHPSGR